jgi:hypothetical protein
MDASTGNVLSIEFIPVKPGASASKKEQKSKFNMSNVGSAGEMGSEIAFSDNIYTDFIPLIMCLYSWMLQQVMCYRSL